MNGDKVFTNDIFSFLCYDTPILNTVNGILQMQDIAQKYCDIALDNNENLEFSRSIDNSSILENDETTENTTIEKENLKYDIPDKHRGAITNKYAWGQTLTEIFIKIPLSADMPLKCDVEIDENNYLQIYNRITCLLEGELAYEVKNDTLTWTIDVNSKDEYYSGIPIITVEVEKKNQLEWWDKVLIGGPKINTDLIKTEHARLHDLDQDNLIVVKKMMKDVKNDVNTNQNQDCDEMRNDHDDNSGSLDKDTTTIKFEKKTNPKQKQFVKKLQKKLTHLDFTDVLDKM